jgi:transcriptional regulator with XRE-family HTH domain
MAPPRSGVACFARLLAAVSVVRLPGAADGRPCLVTARHLPQAGGCSALGGWGAWMGTVEPDDELAGGLLGGARAGAVVLRMLLGHQLRRLREVAGVTPEQAGYAIRASRSKISRLENGRVSFKDRDVADLLTLYGVTSEQMRAGMLELALRANTPGWWAKYGDILPDWFEAYLGLEAAASVIRTFELQFVHGLFQTEDYARAVTMLGPEAAPATEIERRVSLRMKRQDLLAAPDSPRVWSVMDETALRRPVGGRKVMRAQLHHLVEVAALPQVTLQVVPFRRGGHAAAGGSFTILRFAEPDLPDVVYIEQLTSALYLEARAEVDHYLQVMNRLSAEALTPAGTPSFLKEVISET